MKILVDADGVLENLAEEWTALLNERHGTSVKFSDLRVWDMRENFCMLTPAEIKDAELSPELYSRLKPMPGAAENLKKLMNEGHEIYIVTDTPPEIIKYKTDFVFRRYFPFIDRRNYIFCSDKKMINGDILIDDGIHNLTGGSYRKILFSAPYNENFNAEANGMLRAATWDNVYQIIKEMNTPG